jgi:transposase
MRRYIGCDAHATSCTFAVRSSTGRRLRHDVVETNGRALVEYIRQIPGEIHLCLEDGPQAQWLVELLSPQLEEIVVIVPPPRSGRKDDKFDAFDLADVLCTGKRYPRVYKDRQRFRRLWELARVYRMVTRDMVRCKSRVKSFYLGRGITGGATRVYASGERDRWLKRLPVPTRQALEVLYRELDEVARLKEEAQAALIRESHRHRISRVLETAPGLGPVTTALLLPVVVTPHRFRTSRQFWAYCGLGVVTRSSSDWVQDQGQWVRKRVTQTRGLNFNHNHVLKYIFKNAATAICAKAKSHPLQQDYNRLLEKGVKPNLAKLTIARKIAAIVLAMWKQEQPYDSSRRRIA